MTLAQASAGEWFALVNNYGLPLVMLGLVLASLAWVLRSVAKFAAPKITAVTDAHLKLVDTLETQSSKQTDLMAQQNVLLADQGRLIREVHTAVNHGRVT